MKKNIGSENDEISELCQRALDGYIMMLLRDPIYFVNAYVQIIESYESNQRQEFRLESLQENKEKDKDG